MHVQYGINHGIGNNETRFVPAHSLASAINLAHSLSQATRVPASVREGERTLFDAADPQPVVLRSSL